MPVGTHSQQSARPERRAALREALLVAAGRLLRQGQSFTEISVERLCATAGVTRTTFYVYFEDKADLLMAWLGSVDWEDGSGLWPGDPADRVGDRDRLRRLIGAIFDWHRPHIAVLAAAYDAALFDSAVASAFRATTVREMEALRRHIEAGIAGGWIDPGLAPEETAMWLTWMIRRAQHAAATGPEPERHALTESCVEAIWNALYRPAAG
jgi:AcrR family transcriptional regulator